MTTTIRDINELQDRRIMMEKKLPPFGYALILLTAALILFLVVWSTKNYRTYVSQSTGTVQASNKTYIMSSYSGSITELNISEGSYVTEVDQIVEEQIEKEEPIDIITVKARQWGGSTYYISKHTHILFKLDPYHSFIIAAHVQGAAENILRMLKKAISEYPAWDLGLPESETLQLLPEGKSGNAYSIKDSKGNKVLPALIYVGSYCLLEHSKNVLCCQPLWERTIRRSEYGQTPRKDDRNN